MGPWLLQERLGHLDLERLASDESAVRRAVQRPPMLHRFKNTLPCWISSAARRLLDEYAGDALRIWAEGSHVLAVTERLAAFDGIGRKKAVMAVEILQRHFGVTLDGRQFGQVAYDVHVRRVFLRSGLADRDTPEAIESAAASAYPDAPATLDLAAWLVGRQACRPKNPDCDRCRLGQSCARLTRIEVEGVTSQGKRTTNAAARSPS
jgi:endonuclease III